MTDLTSAKGKKGLIFGIANEHSLAYGCARHFPAADADLPVTYLNAKSPRAERDRLALCKQRSMQRKITGVAG
jgi:enoyl-[acyl-carrier-protein] reductase (NADH)